MRSLRGDALSLCLLGARLPPTRLCKAGLIIDPSLRTQSCPNLQRRAMSSLRKRQTRSSWPQTAAKKTKLENYFKPLDLRLWNILALKNEWFCGEKTLEL